MPEAKVLSPKVIATDRYMGESEHDFDKRIEAAILFYLKGGWSLINVTYPSEVRAKIILIK